MSNCSKQQPLDGQRLLTSNYSGQVLAFDPGQTTGVCQLAYRLDARGYITSDGQLTILYAGAIEWAERFEKLPEQFNYLDEGDPVIVEEFRLYASHAKQQINNTFPSPRVIEHIEVLMYQYDMHQYLVRQSASERIQFIPPQFEAQLNMTHKRDAFRHARTYLLRTYGPRRQGPGKAGRA